MSDKSELDLELKKVNNALLMIKCGEILQAIYDSEINFAIYSPCWDGGFTVQIGGEYDRDKPLYDDIRPLADAIRCLVCEVFKKYPESTFTKKYKELLKGTL
jgi:hypothetical protein